MTHHKLKTWPEFFEAVLDGRKPFEIRNEEDRRFEVGDTVTLQEFDPEFSVLTGRLFNIRITYVVRSAWGLPPGLCVFGFIRTSGVAYFKEPVVDPAQPVSLRPESAAFSLTQGARYILSENPTQYEVGPVDEDGSDPRRDDKL